MPLETMTNIPFHCQTHPNLEENKTKNNFLSSTLCLLSQQPCFVLMEIRERRKLGGNTAEEVSL